MEVPLSLLISPGLSLSLSAAYTPTRGHARTTHTLSSPRRPQRTSDGKDYGTRTKVVE